MNSLEGKTVRGFVLVSLVMLSLLLLIACAGSAASLATEGFRHVNPASKLRQAKNDWNAGRVRQGFLGYVTVYRMAIECGARWSIAKVYIDQMVYLSDTGDWQGALDNCSKAAKIVNACDDEGALSFGCFAIDEHIKRETLTRTPPP